MNMKPSPKMQFIAMAVIVLAIITAIFIVQVAAVEYNVGMSNIIYVAKPTPPPPACTDVYSHVFRFKIEFISGKVWEYINLHPAC